MKRYIKSNEDNLQEYTDQDLIDAINKAAKSRRPLDAELAKEILYYVLEPGDQIVVEESDGNMYPYTLEEKSNRYNNFRTEFSAHLSRDLAYETNGYVKTCHIVGLLIYAIQHGKRWYLNLNS